MHVSSQEDYFYRKIMINLLFLPRSFLFHQDWKANQFCENLYRFSYCYAQLKTLVKSK